MSKHSTLAIVGGGLAGAKAAEGARAAGYDGRILLIGQEAGLPYELPPLSKDVLRGDADVASARVHPDGFYAEHDIDVVTDRAVALDTGARRLGLASGVSLRFDRAVLATGASPRRLTVPGADLDGVHYLRTAEDAVRLRDAIRSASRVAVIGGGWIGSEVAASARQMGARVLLVDHAPLPLHRVLGDQVGEVYRRAHVEHGVDLHMGAGVVQLIGAKKVGAIALDDGFIEPVDVVVAGVGAVPNTQLADGARGVRVDNGVVVDDRLETSVGGIYAAGDVASAWHPHYRRHLRIEHWANALNQGTTAGRNAAGADEIYDRLPYFYSDQYDLGMEYVGRSEPGDDVVVRGELDSKRFIAFWHHGGIVTAAMHVNVWDVIEELKAVVAADRPVTAARLADEDIPLAELSQFEACVP